MVQVRGYTIIADGIYFYCRLKADLRKIVWFLAGEGYKQITINVELE